MTTAPTTGRRVGRTRRRPKGAGVVSVVLLAIIGVAGLDAVLAVRQDAAKPGLPGESARQTLVPVLSMRRVPDVIIRAVGRQRLRDRLDEALADPTIAEALPQSCLTASSGGVSLFEFHPHLAVIPASTIKTLTAVGVFAHVRPDETLRTSLRASVAPSGGVVRGDLWLVGGGDPLLATKDYLATFERQPQLATPFEDLVASLADAGVTRITGRVIGDDRRYDDQRTIPTWKQSYSTSGEVGPLSALAVNDGFTDGDGTARKASADPAKGAASLLTRLLQDRGITVSGKASSARELQLGAVDAVAPFEIAAVDSLPAQVIVTEMLQESDNTTAELLLKEIGFRATGTGTTAAGTGAVRTALNARGLDPAGLSSIDGSGLDRGDRATCALLMGAISSDRVDGPLVSGLAVAGTSGTLRKRLADSPLAGNLRAKTGTLNGVSGLVGTLTSARGGRIDFASVFNGLASSDFGVIAANRIAEILYAYPDVPAAIGIAP